MTSAAVVFLLLVGLVALTGPQAAPPTVAEFAPSALHQITKAPAAQAGTVGNLGRAGKPGGRATPPPTKASPKQNKPSGQPQTGTTLPQTPAQFPCVQGPGGPRQILDPQSPPCVPYWAGNNGGATSFGVTANSINVSVAGGGGLFGGAIPTGYLTALADFFNTHFEFYGRKMVVTEFPARGGTFAAPSPSAEIADAHDVHDTYHSFAELGYPDRKGAESVFYDQLANEGVISVTLRTTASETEAHLRQFAPYEWVRGMAVDDLLSSTGQFICADLNKRPATDGGPYAWSPIPPTRKFGIFYTEYTGGLPLDLSPLEQALAACQAPYVVVTGSEASNQSSEVNPMSQFASDHVTSIIMLSDINTVWDAMSAAAGQSYYPEWISAGYLGLDLDNSFPAAQQIPANEANHVVGITAENEWLPPQDDWWYQAFTQGDPSETPPDFATWDMNMVWLYQEMLLLASGIQMAGPHLTPQTFGAALHRTVFPNPGADSAPYYQSRVGFANGTYAFHDSAAAFWYEQQTQGVTEPAAGDLGAVCFVDNGVRHPTGAPWPSESPPFSASTSCPQ